MSARVCVQSGWTTVGSSVSGGRCTGGGGG